MQKLIFLGDSVTDCARKRSSKYELKLESLGHGWVCYTAKTLAARDSSVRVWNRGYSGCLTRELTQKTDWWPDLDDQPLQASIATLMIGINDVWHPFWKNRPHDIDQSIDSARGLIHSLKSRSEQVILCEPVALPCGEVTHDWWPVLDDLTNRQSLLALEMNVHWMPLQEALMKTAKGNHTDYLHDGVHPTDLGHRWLSNRWLQFALDQHILIA